MRLLKTGLAARPATMPITPAEAIRLAPTWRAPGKVISIIAQPAMSSTVFAVRESTRVWVRMLRARRLSATSYGCLARTPSAKPLTARTDSHVMAAISSNPL